MSRLRDGLLAGAVAGALSGAPSTIHALLTGRDALQATRAAGTLLAPASASSARLLASAALAHTAISLGWGVVLAHLLPRERPFLWGPAAGLLIAGLDLGLPGRRFSAIRALPLAPQVADHLAYGLVAALVLTRPPRRHGPSPGRTSPDS